MAAVLHRTLTDQLVWPALPSSRCWVNQHNKISLRPSRTCWRSWAMFVMMLSIHADCSWWWWVHYISVSLHLCQYECHPSSHLPFLDPFLKGVKICWFRYESNKQLKTGIRVSCWRRMPLPFSISVVIIELVTMLKEPTLPSATSQFHMARLPLTLPFH